MKALKNKESGQSIIEYSLIVVVIAVVVIIATQLISSPVEEAMASIGTTLETVSNQPATTIESNTQEITAPNQADHFPSTPESFQVCSGEKFTLSAKLRRCPN